MKYRRLGKTELMVSEIGLGAEWLERHNYEECKAIIDRAEELGINILDCWMCEPNVRTNIGKALAGQRDRWFIQGHIGSTWQDGEGKTADYLQHREEFYMGQMVVGMFDMLAGIAGANERKFTEWTKARERGGELSKEARKEWYLQHQDKGYEHG